MPYAMTMRHGVGPACMLPQGPLVGSHWAGTTAPLWDVDVGAGGVPTNRTARGVKERGAKVQDNDPERAEQHVSCAAPCPRL
jgi:hypothetical protein